MGKIITGGEANEIAGSTVFPVIQRCPTYNELTTNGFVIQGGTYAMNQLVDKAHVTAGNNAKKMTVFVNWSLDTSAYTQNTPYIFASTYYLQITADNVDSDNLTYDNPIKISPNYYQHTGSGTSEYHFTINDQTRNIIATLWCSYPTGWFGTEFHWTTYSAKISDESRRSGAFVNSVPIQAPKSDWMYGTDYITSTEFTVDVLACVSSSTTYGVSQLRKDIKDILNED